MESRELPSGTVTLLFTDIEGSTRMLQELGRDAYVRALTEHRQLLRDVFAAHGGVEVEMQGDSFHFAFRTAADGVTAAVAAQETLRQHPWESQPVRVRIGVHSGQPLQADGLYAGIDVHQAARVMSAAHGGQVVLSERTVALLDGEAAEPVVLSDLGEHRLKDISEPQRLYQATLRGANANFPPLQTMFVSNLPAPASRLIGRGAELREISARLDGEGVRLLTLVGPGGTGKTRLALAVGAELGGRFAGGVHFVGLASIHDAALVLPAAAQALGLRERPGQPLAELLADRLASRRTLAILDNFEHVLGAAPAVSALLAQAPAATFLVTSREPLRVAGEHVLAVPPLGEADAVELFAERAAAANDAFALDHANAAAASTICARVDGLPLAIELAAARVSVLSPASIVQRLDHSLDLLTTGRRDADERHRTLRSTIAWSYDLLGELEQQALTSLAVFPAGFSLDAAETVCEARLDLLSTLAEQSLVRREPDAGGEPRFRLLRVIREYLLDRLEAGGEADRIRRRHAQWCLTSFDGSVAAAEASLERAWLQQHDLRSATTWARGAAELELALEIAIKLVQVLSVRGSLTEARQLLDVLVEEAVDVPAGARARLLHEAAGIALRQGDVERNRSLSAAALRLAAEMDDTAGAVRALAKLAVVALNDGDLETASSSANEATRIAAGSEDDRARVNALNISGTVELARGNARRAQEAFEQALELALSHPDETRRDTIATLHYNIALAALLAGDTAVAGQMLDTTLEESRVIADVEGIAYCFVVQAAQRETEGELRVAALLLAAARRLLTEVGAALEPVERSLAEGTRTAVESALTDEELEEASVAGLELAEAELRRLAS